MTAREFLRRHVFHHIGLKLTALVLATGLWLAVSSSPPAELAVNVGIIFRNLPNQVEISSVSIPNIQVRVRGPERIVRRLDPSEVRAEIDLAEVKVGEHTFDLTKAVTVPDRLEVAQVVPSEVHVAFDSRAFRRIPVRPRVIGTFAGGYSIAQIQTDPQEIEIVGPKKAIDKAESAITDPIDITGVLDRITVARPAYVPDPLVQVQNANPVRITITMKRETSSSQTQP